MLATFERVALLAEARPLDEELPEELLLEDEPPLREALRPPVDLEADFLEADLDELFDAVFLGAAFLAAAFLGAAFFAAAFFGAAFFDAPFEDFEADFEAPLFEEAPFLEGTFSPDFLASDKPIAIACLREVTVLPLRPLFNCPCFSSRIALSTFLPAPFEYLAIMFDFWVSA